MKLVTRESRRTITPSKRSDSGERCEEKDAFIFSRSFLLRTAPHYLNAWNRLTHMRSQLPLKLRILVICFLTRKIFLTEKEKRSVDFFSEVERR